MLSLKKHYWRLLGEARRKKTAIRQYFKKAPQFLLNTDMASMVLQFTRHERHITDKIDGRVFSYPLDTPDGHSLFFEQKLDQASLNCALDLLHGKEAGDIIDLGPGPGWHAIYLASRLSGWHVLTIEPSGEEHSMLADNIASAGLTNISITTANAPEPIVAALNALQQSTPAGKCALVRISPLASGWNGIIELIRRFLPDRPDFLLKFTLDHDRAPEIARELVDRGYRAYRLNADHPPTPHTFDSFLAGEYLLTLDSIITPDDLLLAFAHHPTSRSIHNAIVIGAHRFDERDLFDYALPNLEHLYLFEPLPELVTRLRELATSDPRIQVFATAISNQDGEAVFNVTTNDGMSSSLLEMGSHKNHFPEVSVSRAITVPTLRLESALSQFHIPPPDLIFLDVQGAEFMILSSIPRDLLTSVKVIYTEASMEEIYAGGKPLSELENLLSPDFELVEFYPINNTLSTHGNALFLNTSLIRNQDEYK